MSLETQVGALKTQIKDLTEVEYGDFKRKVGQYINNFERQSEGQMPSDLKQKLKKKQVLYPEKISNSIIKSEKNKLEVILTEKQKIESQKKELLASLDNAEAKIKTQLLTRLDELDNQAKTVKIILFDARVQFKSEEISELTFESIQKHCNNLLERLSHEKNEVKNVQRRLDDLSVECIEVIKTPKDMIQESAVSYLDASGHTITESNHYEPTTPVTVDSEPENTLPEPPVGNMESSTQESTKDDDDSKHQSEYNPDWLSRMQA